ncbi:hypothetical protein ACSBR1_039891 [Camellia fascicularis]
MSSSLLNFSSISSATIASFLLLMLLILNLNTPCNAQLSSTFYDQTCPNALRAIRTSIRQSISRERRMAASLSRLHFHDCFVQGCDASILLDKVATPTSERSAGSNVGSVRGFELIDAAKSEVEKICPGVVSCADILAVAARDASVYVGGPSWAVKLGRRDSTSASRRLAESDLPRFTYNLDQLISNFARRVLVQGIWWPCQFDTNPNPSPISSFFVEGSHTIGQARCFTFRNRIYDNRSNIDAGFASSRRRGCPAATNNGNDNLAPLDLLTPNSFDNNYFKNLIQKKGLLQSDQVLFNGGSTDSIVSEYSKNPSVFQSDFASAMIKMGDIKPLTGQHGVIRRICSALN